MLFGTLLNHNTDGPKFFGTWAQITQPGMAYQEVFQASQPINVPNIQKLIQLGYSLQVLQVRNQKKKKTNSLVGQRI